MTLQLKRNKECACETEQLTEDWQRNEVRRGLTHQPGGSNHWSIFRFSWHEVTKSAASPQRSGQMNIRRAQGDKFRPATRPVRAQNFNGKRSKQFRPGKKSYPEKVLLHSFLELITNWKIRIYRSVCTSVNDFLHHRKIAVSFFQFGRSYPNLPVSWDILSSFVQNLHKHI